MATIFQQILDSENIFKTKNTEINEKQEHVDNIRKKIESVKSHTVTVSACNIGLRVKIDNQTVEKELLLQKKEIVGKQIINMKETVDMISSELEASLLKYQKSREELIDDISSNSEKIIEANANIKQMDPQKYELFCHNELQLEDLQKVVKELISQRNVKQQELEGLLSKTASMKNDITSARELVSDLRKSFDNSQMSTDRSNTFNKMKVSISCYETEIASMISEINSKRMYIKNFKNSSAHNNSNYIPRHSTHFTQPGVSTPNQPNYNLKNMHHTSYQPLIIQKSSESTVMHSERMVVTRPPVPSSTPEEELEEDLFDDDLISDDLLRACDEAQKSRKGL